jgi:HAMP domain-containing protein
MQPELGAPSQHLAQVGSPPSPSRSRTTRPSASQRARAKQSAQTKHSRIVSVGGWSIRRIDAPDFAARGRDEIGMLGHALSRMRRSLVQAMNMLEA